MSGWSRDPKQAILDIAKHIQYDGEMKLGYSEQHDGVAQGDGLPDRKLIRRTYLMKKGLSPALQS